MGSPFGLAKRVTQASAQSEEKISFAIIGGHGNSEVINFGKRLYKSDLNGGGAKRLSESFKPNAEIVLASCSVGEDNGIAQKISEQMSGLKIIASKNTATSIDMHVSYDNEGNPHFLPDFGGGEENATISYEEGVRT